MTFRYIDHSPAGLAFFQLCFFFSGKISTCSYEQYKFNVSIFHSSGQQQKQIYLHNVIINPILLFIFTQLTLSLDLYLLDWVKDDVFCSFEKFGL